MNDNRSSAYFVTIQVVTGSTPQFLLADVEMRRTTSSSAIAEKATQRHRVPVSCGRGTSAVLERSGGSRLDILPITYAIPKVY